jgi:hypothetical protein
MRKLDPLRKPQPNSDRKTLSSRNIILFLPIFPFYHGVVKIARDDFGNRFIGKSGSRSYPLASISIGHVEGAERETALPQLEPRDSSSTMQAVLSHPSPPTAASFYS